MYLENRIDIYDYMKCIAIIIVVMGHLYNLSYDDSPLGISTLSKVNVFIQMCEMPLFFFLCGLFVKEEASIKGILKVLTKKVKRLLIPFISCSILAAYLIRNSDIIGVFQDNHKYGYWFLESLFLFYVYFLIISYIIKCINYKVVKYVIHIISVFVLYGLSKMLSIKNPELAVYLNAYALKQFYLYFILGYLFFQNYTSISRLLIKKQSITISLSYLFIILFFYFYYINPSYNKIIGVLSSISVIVSLYILLLRYKEYFPAFIKNSMLYIGKHTLDIYVLHYFLLPRNQVYFSFLFGINTGASNNIILEIIGGIAIALLVICACLFISILIRLSKPITLILLGHK